MVILLFLAVVVFVVVLVVVVIVKSPPLHFARSALFGHKVGCCVDKQGVIIVVVSHSVF
jgi:hypothetical protein